MKTKKLLLSAAVAFSMAMPAFATETGSDVSKSITTESSASPRALEIMTRLEEIKAMDVSSMSRTEKKALRKETKAMEKEVRQTNGGGVYLSVGALLLIIILLVVLL